MQDIKNVKRLRELEAKWLNGTITEKEAIEYSFWYNSDQDMPVFIPSDIAKSKELHRKKLLRSIRKKISNEPKKISIIREKSKNYTVFKYAALVFIFITLGYLFYKNDNRAPIRTIAKAILPGKKGLILTLGNNTKIMLDSVNDGVIAVENGVKVIKKDGKISYEGKGTNSVFNVASTDKCRQYLIELPDGSKVWLNSLSSIKYPISFDSKERLVEIQGEVYFEIVHKEHQPFVVKAGEQRVEVLGTHFNINAYSDEQYIATTLLQGRVKVKTGLQQTIISPGQQAITAHNTTTINVIAVDTTLTVAWMKEKFMFDNTELSTIMRQIKRWYGVEVKYENGTDNHIRFSGSTSMGQNLQEVLKVLELSGIRFKVENNIVTVLQ
ncbi:MAG: DUF4974 domain-containing protein [Arachidicoccus sp.]|nr:DUF4974 domain-containing protein [Arachidicoccus sp.]